MKSVCLYTHVYTQNSRQETVARTFKKSIQYIYSMHLAQTMCRTLVGSSYLFAFILRLEKGLLLKRRHWERFAPQLLPQITGWRHSHRKPRVDPVTGGVPANEIFQNSFWICCLKSAHIASERISLDTAHTKGKRAFLTCTITSWLR